jgi:GTP-binding protein
VSEAVPLRNVALVAHVDHGKTTLVDAILKAGSTFAAHQAVVDRVMDSNDQERERGITILAKAASIHWKGVKINLVDTPGHADFGGEVERALTMVDGVLLLVDAAEGPLPQTRYVLSKAVAADLPAVVVINKVDRQDARSEEVLDEIYQLFLDLEVPDHHIEFEVVSAVAREGRAMVGVGMPADDADLAPLLDTLVRAIPAPIGDPEQPLQASVTNLDASDYLGRLAIGRVVRGTLRAGRPVALLKGEGNAIARKPAQVLGIEGIGRVEQDEIVAGDLFILAGFPEVEIGDTIADPSDPDPLPRLTVDEPVLRMTFGPNTSPLAGKDGAYVTSRHIRERLQREVLGNVAIKLEDTETPDVIQVAGRGELQLAVLIETMRREGYELTASNPEPLTKTVDGELHEPMELFVCDIPDTSVGTVTERLGPRKGRMMDMGSIGSGRTRLQFRIPARGLIGFRSEFLTITRGEGIMSSQFDGYSPWFGHVPKRTSGAIISDRAGETVPYALFSIQERGSLFVGPGVQVYPGMVIGEHSHPNDLNVNACRGRKLTNIRAANRDENVILSPPREMSLEKSLEWIAPDELVEVTPKSVRIRKRMLDFNERYRAERDRKREIAT